MKGRISKKDFFLYIKLENLPTKIYTPEVHLRNISTLAAGSGLLASVGILDTSLGMLLAGALVRTASMGRTASSGRTASAGRTALAGAAGMLSMPGSFGPVVSEM